MTLQHAYLLALIGCSSSEPAVCGNGVVESGEQCDRGVQNGMLNIPCSSECKSVSVKVVQMGVTWAFQLVDTKDPIPGYVAPGCSNFGATRAHVVFDGPSPSDKRVDCSRYGLKYPTCLPGATGQECDPMPSAGMYSATVTLEDANGKALTTGVSSPKKMVVAGPEVTFPIAFQKSDFPAQDYTGRLDFRPAWGAAMAGCSEASPKVTSESVLLVRDSEQVPVAGMTKDGLKLDGTAGACFLPKGGLENYQSIDNLPWGRYRLTLFSQGKLYCTSVPVFVNPGKYNSTYDILVPSYNADAGVCP